MTFSGVVGNDTVTGFFTVTLVGAVAVGFAVAVPVPDDVDVDDDDGLAVTVTSANVDFAAGGTTANDNANVIASNKKKIFFIKPPFDRRKIIREPFKC